MYDGDQPEEYTICKITTFICVVKRETTSENSCTELCGERGNRLGANREVNRLPKYAQIVFLQNS